MVFDPPTKSRRRVVGRILIPLLIAVALIIAVVVTAAGEETRIELEYLNEIKEQVSELSRSGLAVQEVMPRLRQIDRDEFTTVMDGATVDVDVALAFVAGEPPVDSLIPVWSLYRQAVEAWNTGLEALNVGILQAADQPDDATVTEVVGDGLAALRAGDSIYDSLRAELERAEVPDPVTPLSDVNLSPAEGGLFSLAGGYVAAARASTNNLGLHPGLRVSQVLGEPSWQLNVEGEAVVPFTEEIVFSVVVTNVGNVESPPETVDIVLDGGEVPVRSSAEVPALRAGGQTTIELDPMPVEPEILYTITAELLVTGTDTDLTDNSQSAEFTVNEG